nr:hypothetical protein [Leuven Tombus-like virus 1]
MLNNILGNANAERTAQAAQIETLQTQIKDLTETVRRLTSMLIEEDREIDSNRTLLLKQELAKNRATAALATKEAHRQLRDSEIPPRIDEAVAYLKIYTMGKEIDSKYATYCAALLRVYLTTRMPQEQHAQLTIVESALQRHMDTLHPVYRFDLDRIVRLNDSISHIKRYYFKFLNWRIEIPWLTVRVPEQNNLNAITPANMFHRYRWLSHPLILLGGSMFALGAGYVIIRVSTQVTTSIIIPKLLKLPGQLYTIATAPFRKLNTMVNSLCGSIASRYSNESLDLGPVSNMSITSISPPKGNFISHGLTKSITGIQSVVMYVRSLSWRNTVLPSIRLLDSYKPDIQLLTSSTGDISNHLSELLKMTSILAKDVTTISLTKSTECLRNIGITLSAIIAPLTRESLQKCSGSLIGSTSAVSKMTLNSISYASEQLTTVAKLAMERSIDSGVPVCRATLTRLLETVYSTTIYLQQHYGHVDTRLMSLLTETTRLYSQMFPSTDPFLQLNYYATIWFQSFSPA